MGIQLPYGVLYIINFYKRVARREKEGNHEILVATHPGPAAGWWFAGFQWRQGLALSQLFGQVQMRPKSRSLFVVVSG